MHFPYALHLHCPPPRLFLNPAGLPPYRTQLVPRPSRTVTCLVVEGVCVCACGPVEIVLRHVEADTVPRSFDYLANALGRALPHCH